MGRIERSWTIFRSSFDILKENKTLLVFPMINFMIILFICSLFIIPAGYFGYKAYGGKKGIMKQFEKLEKAKAQPAQTPKQQRSEIEIGPVGWAAWGILYFISIFIATYLNVAFVHEILNAVRGEPVSIAGGFSAANSKIVQIFMWACLAGTVGFIIKLLEERMGILGQIIMKIIGVAWSIASLFVIPVIITEETSNLNPFSYLKKSAKTITLTWGESIAGYVGFGMLNGLVIFLSMLLMIACNIGAIAAFGGQQTGLIIAGLITTVWFLGLIAFLYVVSVAEKIFKGALYLYASEGTIPEQYSQTLLDTAWKVK